MAALIDAGLFGVPYFLLKRQPAGLLGALAGLLLFLSLTGVQCWLLARDGQTLGKRAAGIRVVCALTGGNPGFLRVVVLRSIINGALSYFWPYLLLDLGLIFRADRRCLHDWLARTKVVAAAPPGGAPEGTPA